MSVNNIKHKLIHEIAKELFSFGYSLIPDELQVEQIVVDVFHLGQKDLEAKELLAELLDEPNDANVRFLYKKRLCRILYRLSLKRYIQIKDGIEVSVDESAFSALDLEQKAVLFLKHKMNFDLNDLSSVIEGESNELLSTLSAARNDVLLNAGEVNF